jgi:hypothetical protein
MKSWAALNQLLMPSSVTRPGLLRAVISRRMISLLSDTRLPLLILTVIVPVSPGIRNRVLVLKPLGSFKNFGLSLCQARLGKTFPISASLSQPSPWLM